MINSFLEIYFIAISAGLIAAIYKGILAYEPVLNWWFRFGNKYEGKWFFPPIWGCIRCISGQMGLWAFIFLKVIPLYLTFDTLEGDLIYLNIAATIFQLIACICMAIFTGTSLIKIVTEIKD